jgi:rhamnosyltransferase subunit A
MHSVHREILSVRTGHRVYTENHTMPGERENVILVNGALSTTQSFRQTLKYLLPNYNVTLYDLPHFGQSAPHNPPGALLTSTNEVDILCSLIDAFDVDHVMSISWGGLAALLAIARSPGKLRSAAIGSFSPFLNGPMLAYMTSARQHLEAGDFHGAADLLNGTVGQYLPRLLKACNHQYITSLDKAQFRQIQFHLHQMHQLPVDTYLAQLRHIDIPVLFVNGELDDYTTAADVQVLRRHLARAEFARIDGAGHFLDLENRRSWTAVSQVVTAFLRTGQAGVTAVPSVADDKTAEAALS